MEYNTDTHKENVLSMSYLLRDFIYALDRARKLGMISELAYSREIRKARIHLGIYRHMLEEE